YFGAGSGVSTFENAGGECVIIATENQTLVTITPMTTTTGGHVGARTGNGTTGTPHPYTIELERGQCYFLKSDGSDSESDISGSLIEATKPIALISGHENAHIGGVSEHNLEGRDL